MFIVALKTMNIDYCWWRIMVVPMQLFEFWSAEHTGHLIPVQND